MHFILACFALHSPVVHPVQISVPAQEKKKNKKKNNTTHKYQWLGRQVSLVVEEDTHPGS